MACIRTVRLIYDVLDENEKVISSHQRMSDAALEYARQPSQRSVVEVDSATNRPLRTVPASELNELVSAINGRKALLGS